MDQQRVVRSCPGCGTAFTLQRILEDPEIKPHGMQFEDAEMKSNVFYFNHTRLGCGSTFVLPVTEFRSLIAEPSPEAALADTSFCEHQCLTIDDLKACNQHCRYAPFRRFLIKMRAQRVPT